MAPLLIHVHCLDLTGNLVPAAFSCACLLAVLRREEARAKLEDLQRRPTRLQVIASSYWPCAHFDQFSANRLVCFYSSTCSLAHRCLTGRCFCNVARSLDPWFLGSLDPWFLGSLDPWFLGSRSLESKLDLNILASSHSPLSRFTWQPVNIHCSLVERWTRAEIEYVCKLVLQVFRTGMSTL